MSIEHTVTTTFNLVPPAKGVLSVIGGTQALGQTLVAGDGTWTGSPTSFTYQWQDCDPAGRSCVSIAGATDSVYKLVAGDVAHTLRIVVAASNAGGARAATSAPTSTVTILLPVVSHVRLGFSAFRAHNGTTLKLTLSGAATVNVVVTQTRAGRNAGGASSKPVKLNFTIEKR